jgi:hypothetical protein
LKGLDYNKDYKFIPSNEHNIVTIGKATTATELILRSKTFKGMTCANVGVAYALYKRLVTLNTPE